MTKRLISLLLVFCVIFSVMPISASAAGAEKDGADEKPAVKNPFEDIAEDSWCHDDVIYVYVNRIFLGVSDTAFDPEGGMSRAMFVTVLGRMAGVNADNYRGSSAFTDVAEDAYYAPYVAWAAKYGITGGTGYGLFSPDAPATRQEMAVFFVRYFEKFDVDYGAGEKDGDSTPGDMDVVADWAKDAVLKLWHTDLLRGDGVNFIPESLATRAQAAAICHRADKSVSVWYSEPGVVSDRDRIDPFEEESGEEEPGEEEPEKDYGSAYYSVRFYDGAKLIDTLYAIKGKPLKSVPSVEKSSKEGAVLLGYYKDKEFTEPFYAEEPVLSNMRVYAEYQDMGSIETLNFTTFTQLDQRPDLSFSIRRISGDVEASKAAVLSVKDGSDPVELAIQGSGDSCTVSAVGGFSEGCSYELTLADGWIFDEKPETIRTASFSILKKEVDNMRMSEDIKYLQDTDAINYTIDNKTHEVLTSELLTEAGGSFTYSGNPSLDKDDILCVYVGMHPEQRNAGNGAELLDPAIYVKVSEVNGGTVTFKPLDADDQMKLYDIPDNFPLMVKTLPTETTGTVSISELDISMYETMMGKDDGTLNYAKERINVGDFVTLYAGDIDSSDDLYFGKITGYDEETGDITYTETTEQAILESMDLYENINLTGGDLVSEEQQAEIVEAVQEQLDNSNFGEQAAMFLAELVASTDEFQNIPDVQVMLESCDGDGALSDEDVELFAAGMTLDTKNVKVTARLITNGGDLHFNGGVQLAVDVKAKFNAPIDNSLGNTLSIDLAGSFVQEVAVKPTVKGSLVTKKILFIPVPIGVNVGASVDVRSYTALSFDAEISTHDNSGVLYSTHIVSDLKDMLSTSENTGLSGDYENSLEALMEKYSELLAQETDWITLFEKPIFEGVEVGIKAIGIGIEGSFVVKTDMSIAIGSNLEYETGKRYSFWFKVGLFKPTAGSSSMDLIDESFAFQFYVMGKLGVRAGVKLMLYVQVGGGALAKVGVSADFGPYIKMYGFFIYEVSKYRPKGTSRWDYNEQMTGALFLEFGLYVTLGFEATALKVFEYSRDFLNEEIPLLTAGESRYYYGFNYKPEKGEYVVIRDEDGNSENGISMKLPDSLRELSYMTLDTGLKGSQSMPLDKYRFTVSNPDFSFDSATGEVSVKVPKNTHFMECDLTITYMNGKLTFSNYDMSVTVPLVWTDLSDRELNEYFTASVRVGNSTDGYETVWSKKVRRGQSFDLPGDEDIKALINYNDTKYSGAAGYESGQQTKDLTIITDTVYDYNVESRAYNLTVSGIQNADGGTRDEVFTAKYGQTFDFSYLKGTGTEVPGETYTKFTGVSAEGLDLSQPVNGAMAEKLKNGATANYVDDSVTAVFTFSGITHSDVTVKARKGTTPDVPKIADSYENVSISDITPALGNIDQSTNYVVDCVKLSGARADVTFDVNASNASDVDAPPTLNSLVGSLIVNLPVVERNGYKFDGWFTEDDKEATTQTVPEGGITLYAHWTPNEYTINFKVNGGSGENPASKAVTYDRAYGELPTPTPTSGKRFVGWYTASDGGEEITSDKIVKTAEDQTLYAHYKDLVKIDKDWLDFGDQESFTYSKDTSRSATYAFDQTKMGDDGIAFPTDGFILTYVGTSGNGGSTVEPVKADTYNVRVTRPADELYAAFEAEYEDVLVINKANRDPSSVSIDTENTKYGFNYLSVGIKVDDLGPGAKVSFNIESGDKEGISTSDGLYFFYGLSANTSYTANVSVTGDPNYNNVSGSVTVSTKTAPTESWSGHADSLSTEISTPGQMAALMNEINSGNDCAGKTFTLKNDIDLSDYEWNPGGTFNGTFNGNGHKIYGLYINKTGADDVGLFSSLGSSATVQNVLLAGGEVRGRMRVGGIAGQVLPGSNVKNCASYATVYAQGLSESADVGGIVGKSDRGNVVSCVNYGSISGSNYHVGGIVGYNVNKAQITNCANFGAVYGSTGCVGGIVGETNDKESKVYNCVNVGSVTGTSKYRGAIVGRNNDNQCNVEQGYYKVGSAPDRNGAGSEDGARDDKNYNKNIKCASFNSFTDTLSWDVENDCQGQSIVYALNHWAERCNSDRWTQTGPDGAPVPENIPKL